MAIRTKKYRYNAGGDRRVRAIQITEKNLTEIVAYISRNGGAATGHLGRPEFKRPARIRIKQRNYGETWGKVDWRVAEIGDYIVRYDFPKGEFYRDKGAIEFARVKARDFHTIFTEDV